MHTTSQVVVRVDPRRHSSLSLGTERLRGRQQVDDRKSMPHTSLAVSPPVKQIFNDEVLKLTSL